jgi:hypothetical protein
MRSGMRLAMSLAVVGVLAGCSGGEDDPPAVPATQGAAEPTASAPQPSPPPAPQPPGGMTQAQQDAALQYIGQLNSPSTRVKIVKELGEYKAMEISDAAAGETFSLFGARDDAGLLTALDQFAMTDSSGKTTVIRYPDAGERVVTVGDDVTITFKRQANGVFTAEFTERSTATTFITDLPSTAAATAEFDQKSSLLLRLKAATTAAASRNSIPVTITTKNCGVVGDPVGNRVKLRLVDGAGKSIGSGVYTGQRTALGTYVVQIPDASREAGVDLRFVKDSMSSAAKVLEVACQADKSAPYAFSQGCLTVAARIAATTALVGTPAAVKFLAACEAAAVGFKGVCNVKDKSLLPVPDGFTDSGGVVPDSLLYKSIQDILLDSIPESVMNAQVVPFVEALPKDIVGKAGIIGPDTASVSVELDNQFPNVGEIILNPPSVSEGQSYAASSTLRCMPFDSTARMTVSGSDGYAGEVSRNYSNNTATDTITLSVPGGDSGVRDTITLRVKPRTTEETVRQAFITFQ